MFKIFTKKREFIFNDKFGQKFKLFPLIDDIKWYKKHKTITDSINVINYILANINEGDTCVDIGANLGATSVSILRRIGPQGFLVSIEPDPQNYWRVGENIILNGGKDNFIVLPFAVGDENKEVTLTVFPNENGWQTIGKPSDYANREERYHVKVLLKTYLEIEKIVSIDKKVISLVKIDVEGAELKILSSMKKKLRNGNIEKVIFECSKITAENFQETQMQLIDFWTDLDYTLRIIEENGNTKPLDINNMPKHFDCVAELNSN